MKKFLLIITIVALSALGLFAQNTCGDQLKVAQRRFDDGLLEDIPQLLAGCMKSGFTKEEKTNAYKLLIQTYLFSENQEKADEVMLQFLKDFPSYAIANNDPKEFVNLYSTYRTKPIFKIEAKLGVNFCMPSLVEPYGTTNIETAKAIYKAKFGITGEVNFLNHLYKNFDYSIGFSYIQSNFTYDNKPTSYSTVTGDFKNQYIGLPIAIRYNYRLFKYNFFAKIGIEPVYLLSSSVSLSRTDNIIGRQEPFTGTEDLLSAHKRFDIRPMAAIGVAFNVKRNTLNISVGFKLSTMVQLNQGKQYTNTTLQTKYFFAEDMLHMNQSHISVSFIRPIYKPKKLR